MTNDSWEKIEAGPAQGETNDPAGGSAGGGSDGEGRWLLESGRRLKGRFHAVGTLMHTADWDKCKKKKKNE